MVGLSAAMGSDCCHTVTRNVPIQARHPLSWPRKVTCTTKEPPPPRCTAYLSTTRGPEVVVGDRRCLPDATMGVAWTVEVTGYSTSRALRVGGSSIPLEEEEFT